MATVAYRALRVEKDSSKWATRPAYRVVNLFTGRTVFTAATRKEAVAYLRGALEA